MPNSCFIVTFQTAGVLGISAYSTGGSNTSVPLEVFGPGVQILQYYFEVFGPGGPITSK